jgi:hypothetical protein
MMLENCAQELEVKQYCARQSKNEDLERQQEESSDEISEDECSMYI